MSSPATASSISELRRRRALEGCEAPKAIERSVFFYLDALSVIVVLLILISFCLYLLFFICLFIYLF